VIPFSDAELLAQGFDYAAIGHYHTYGMIGDRAAYSGCVQGRGLDETGEKCVIVGEIEGGKVRIEAVEIAERRVLSVESDVTGARDHTAVLSRVTSAIETAGARECDVVHIELTGTMLPDTPIDLQALESLPGFFHVSVDARRIEPDYDLEALGTHSSAEKLKSAFVRRMRELVQTAGTEDERRILQDATYYGLYALDGRKLEPRDAD
jgi:DNA repair exonuclease SbcCD nuclease subunit